MARHRVLTMLRWSDMDAYGHVNNVQFLRLIEDARVIALSAPDSDEGGSLANTGLLVARSEIEYLNPLVYRPAPVAIDLWVTEVAGASFEMGYELLDDEGTAVPESEQSHHHPPMPDGSVIYARASTKMVVYDLEARRPRRLSADERVKLDAWRDGPVPWRHRRPVKG